MNLYDLITIFENNSNKEEALNMKKYMLNKFEFLGIRSPKRQELWKEYFKFAKSTKIIDWDFVNYCWQNDYREIHYIAAHYLKYMENFLNVEDIEKIEKLIITNSWWDTSDILDRVVGEIIYKNPNCANIMIDWSLSNSIWLRRVAIDHQLLRKEKTNKDLLEQIIINNLNSKEFFINKAIGWALRDYSKTNPEWVRNFLEKNKENMSKLSIREASKYIYNKK